MSLFARTLTVLVVLAVFGACEDPPLTPDAPETTVANAPGGDPGPPPGKGPPSHVILPDRGPPADVPAPLPPHAGPPGTLDDIVEVGAGGRFSCALRSDGLAFCWGSNGSGQLGDGTRASSSTPVQVVGGHTFARLEVGNFHACGLTAEGEAFCWGSNNDGELGAGLPDPFVPVPSAVAGDLRFTDLDLGLANTCGVATDGLTYCWGQGADILDPTPTGGNASDVPVPVTASATLGFVEVEVAFFHACGRDAGGAVHCWGLAQLFGNGATSGGSSDPVPAADGQTFAGLELGNNYTCALDGAGAAYCWGTPNDAGQNGNGTAGVPDLTPVPVTGGLTFASLDAHDDNSVLAHTCAVALGGEAWCWGNNDEGQLGVSGGEACEFVNSSFPCHPSPVQVSGGLSFEAVSVGLDHTCGVATDGRAFCWGDNGNGELGDGSMTNSSTPVAVAGLDADRQIGSVMISPLSHLFELIGATQQFTAQAVDDDGNPVSPQPVLTWTSEDPAVATVDGDGLVTALAAGSTHIVASTSDGLSARAVIGVNPIDPVTAFKEAWVGPGRPDGVVVWGGLLADEWTHSGTFQTRLQVDQRSSTPDNSGVADTYERLEDARRAFEWEIDRFESSDPGSPEIGRYRALAGFTYLTFAETWCSGVPLDDPDVGLTTTELFGRAATRFEEALASPITPDYELAARVGLARSHLGRGQFANAGAAVAPVPTSFLLAPDLTAGSDTENGVFLLNDGGRISLAEQEGGNGLPFRSAMDPRVPWEADGVGFDGVTPQYRLLTYTSADDDIPLASGQEARLIAAEAALADDDVPAFLGHLNDLRTPLGMAPLADPGSDAAREDLLFRERAFWLMATGRRLGDLRRLVAFYGRAPSSVFPTGVHPKFGNSYGTDANLAVPADARGPGFTGCTDRQH